MIEKIKNKEEAIKIKPYMRRKYSILDSRLDKTWNFNLDSTSPSPSLVEKVEMVLPYDIEKVEGGKNFSLDQPNGLKVIYDT